MKFSRKRMIVSDTCEKKVNHRTMDGSEANLTNSDTFFVFLETEDDSQIDPEVRPRSL